MLDETRLDRLISAYFDRQLSVEEKAEFEAMLLGSARARQIFLDQSEWHGLAREWALQSQMSLVMGSAEMVSPLSTPGSRKVIPFPRKLAIIAACLAGIGIAIPFLLPEPKNHAVERVQENRQSVGDNVALLVQSYNVEWETGSTRPDVGTALAKGTLKIKSGTVRLDFYSGARIFLEGPASLDLLSPDLARLNHGKLTARVPPAAEGFTITSGDIRVIDRGTDFGINMRGPDDREIHVFEGEIELQGTIPPEGKPLLREGEAASIINGKWTWLTADRRGFADPTAMYQAADRETESRWDAWQAAADKLDHSSGLLVHFDFEQVDRDSMSVQNRALDSGPNSNGSIIGCDFLPGRWSKKTALGFTSTSDRVRFRLEGETKSLTLLAWVRINSLPQDHNALFSMSPDLVGEIHWKLDQSGRLLIGLRGSPSFSYDAWERLVSPQVVSREDFGQWFFLATVIDGEQGMLRHFVNGEEIASGPLKRRPMIPLGLCNIGNFDEAGTGRVTFQEVHSLNGRVDEFAILKRALSAKEIAEIGKLPTR